MGNKSASLSKNQNTNNQYYSNNADFEKKETPDYKYNNLNIFNDDDEIKPATTAKTSTIMGQKEVKDNTEKNESFNLADKLSLEIKLKHKQVQLNSSASITLPLLVTLDVDAIKTSNKASIDLICVIDHSGSMEGEKMQLLKDTFKYLLELLDENDRLSIITFESTARRITPLFKMNEKNKENTINQLNKVYATGGTNIQLGMKYAFEVIKQRRYINNVTSILLLSDGLDGGAENRVKDQLTSYNLKDTFTINTFGYGSDHDPKLMSAIAQLKDGSFYFVEKLDTVDECFVDCLGGLISVVGQDVNIAIKAEPSDIFPEIKITKAFGVEGTWKQVDDNYVTSISQLISGKKKNYLLEIQIPKTIKEVDDITRNIKIASVTCTVKGVKNSEVGLISKTKDLITLFLNEVEEEKDNEADRDVMFNYYRVKGAEIMNEARSLSDKKKYEEAKKILQNFKEDIANSKLKEDEAIKNLIKDLDDAINNVRPEVYENTGKHYMLQNVVAQMEERSNLTSNVKYGNSMQSDMVFKSKARKAK